MSSDALGVAEGGGRALPEFLLARITEDEAAIEGFHQGSDPDFFWGPVRILAECEARRGIVRLAAEQPQTFAEAMRWLAEPYADHPDYQEVWKP